MIPLNSCFIISGNTRTSCKNRNTCLLTSKEIPWKPLRVDSVYDMFDMEKRPGIKITPHMLRRYYANTRWEADWPLEMISQALGHNISIQPYDIWIFFRRQAENSKSGILPPIFQTLRSRTVFGKQEVKIDAGKYICLAAGRTGR